jgi:SulP family sulfate permease
MVLLIGAFQIGFGLLRLGRLTRFISYSVMTGFIMGIAVLTVLTQLPTATGYEPDGESRIEQTFNILLNLSQVSLVAIGLTVLALAGALVLRRTFVGNFGSLLAIVVPSLAVARLDVAAQTVGDVGEIEGGLPLPSLPSLADLRPEVITGAIAVAAIILVQGAGVSQSVPNPDGSRRSMSRDFVGQGAANIVSGLFRGLPVGGSLGSTALSVLAGARSRAAAIFAGVWMAVILVAFGGLISYVAMPTLAALLMLASLSTIKPKDVRSIWSTGWQSRIAAAVTFFATLLLPIELAVALGVALPGLLYLVQASNDVSVVELVELGDGGVEERKAPEQLESNKVTILDVYGHLFYAGARIFERLLPEPARARDLAVVLRLRGRTQVGATLIEVLLRYADKLTAANGRLYLSGLSSNVHDEFVESGKLALDGPVRAFEATPRLGHSTRQAYAEAEAWLVRTAQARPEPHEEAAEREGL